VKENCDAFNKNTLDMKENLKGRKENFENDKKWRKSF
jgi:hypothetical protein